MQPTKLQGPQVVIRQATGQRAKTEDFRAGAVMTPLRPIGLRMPGGGVGIYRPGDKLTYRGYRKIKERYDTYTSCDKERVWETEGALVVMEPVQSFHAFRYEWELLLPAPH